MNQSQKGLAQFLIPGRNAAKLFELVEEPFHLLASPLEVVIISDRSGPVALGRDHWHDALGKELLAEVIAVRTLGHHRMGERWLGWHLGEHCLKDGTRMTWACRED